MGRKLKLLILFFHGQGETVYRQKCKKPYTVNHTAADHHRHVLGQRPEVHRMPIQPCFIWKTMVAQQKNNGDSLYCQCILFCKFQFVFHDTAILSVIPDCPNLCILLDFPVEYISSFLYTVRNSFSIRLNYTVCCKYIYSQRYFQEPSCIFSCIRGSFAVPGGFSSRCREKMRVDRFPGSRIYCL